VHRTGDRGREHREILRIGREFEVEMLVVGVPYSLDGGVGPAAQGILAEVAELAATTDLAVETYDERLTTVTADRLLQDQGLDAKERRKVVDKVAAAILLQAWLDHRHLTASDTDAATSPQPDAES
jgi:putative holliday junction resolvase